jgi:hypothetical protein
VYLFFDDLEGFEKSDELVFLEGSITILSVDGDTVMHASSLSNNDGSGTDMSPLQTSAFFVANFPQHKAEKYIAHIMIWDEISRGNGFVKYEFPFSIVENPVVDIKSKGITYQSIFLISKANDLTLVKPEITAPDRLKIVFDHPDGLVVKDGVVFPAMSLLLTDAVGDTIFYQENTMEDNEQNGMNYSYMSKNSLSVTLPIDGVGALNNPCHLKVILSDLKSDKTVEIKSELTIHGGEQDKAQDRTGSEINVRTFKIEANGKETTSKLFTEREMIKIGFDGVAGLARKGGLAYPQMSFTIVNQKGDTLMSQENMLGSLKEGTKSDPIALQVSFRASLPYENKEKYKGIVTIWDTKGKGVYVKEIPFKIIANDLLKVSEKGISTSSLYLWDLENKLYVSSNELTVSKKYYFVIKGIKGLDEIDGKVYPLLSMEMTAEDGTVILDSKDIITEMSQNGITAKELAESTLPIELTLIDGVLLNPYTLKIVLRDKKSRKKLVVKTKLILITGK